MGYTLKRYLKYLALLVCIALLIAGVLYAIKSAVSVGDGINDNTDKKYERSEPTEGAPITAGRGREAILSLEGSDL